MTDHKLNGLTKEEVAAYTLELDKIKTLSKLDTYAYDTVFTLSYKKKIDDFAELVYARKANLNGDENLNSFSYAMETLKNELSGLTKEEVAAYTLELDKIKTLSKLDTYAHNVVVTLLYKKRTNDFAELVYARKANLNGDGNLASFGYAMETLKKVFERYTTRTR